MPILEVKCTVSDCFFHTKGNLCGAEKIEINMNSQASKNGDTEFASEFLFSPKKAAFSTDTCCNTFKPKNKEAHHSKKKN
jgi:hypothetical protein